MQLLIDLNVPAQVLDDAVTARIREDAILRLFAEHRISSATACELLGFERTQFRELLQSRNIPAFNYTLEDLQADRDAIAAWQQRDRESKA